MTTRHVFEVDAAVTLSVEFPGDVAAARRHLAELLRQRRPITVAAAAIPLGSGVTLAPHLWPDADRMTAVTPI